MELKITPLTILDFYRVFSSDSTAADRIDMEKRLVRTLGPVRDLSKEQHRRKK